MERLDAFMARAAAAYYAGGEGIGRDFTTAPEMSQAFGECLGLWAALTWQSMGAPDRVVLAELGPGRGTLMADALRAVDEMVPDFARAAEVHLVETSPALRTAQAKRLDKRVTAWHTEVGALPEGPAIILANEFFDALPIRQFVKRADGWRERFVQHGSVVEQATDYLEEAPDDAVREIGEVAQDVVATLAARLAAQGGALLVLDYGPAESGLGDTLQALHNNAVADALRAAGEADITAHVDFATLAATARTAGAAAHGPLPMGLFLQRLGLMSRSAMLAQSAPAAAGLILSAAQRLVAPEGMGRLFKALAIAHPALSTPIGFEA